MDRRDAYHGQVVTEGDVDEWFDDVENMEEALAQNAHIQQALITATPDPSTYGGIVTGLDISGVAGNAYVTVALGEARDNGGQHIELEAPATISLAKTGQTTIADSTLAEGDGAAIAGGSCAVGEYIVISIFAQFAQDLQDPQTDAGGSTVYYDRLESFRFYLAVGSADYTHANVIASSETPTRAALANGMVLLADVIAENDAGTMKVVAVMNTTGDWKSTYDPPGNYALLAGRRADWLTVTNADEFAEADAALDIVRAGSAREALFSLAKRVNSGAIVSDRFDAVPTLFRMNSRFGHPARPREFYSNMAFNYASVVHDPLYSAIGDSFVMYALGGGTLSGSLNGAVVSVLNASYGYTQILTSTVLNEGMVLQGPVQYHLNIAPFAVAMLRFSIDTSLSNVDFTFGLRQSYTSFTNSACMVMATDGSGTISGRVVNSAGVVGNQTNHGTIVADTWNTIRIVVTASNSAWFQLNNGTWYQSVVSGAMAAGANYARVTIKNLLVGSRRSALIGQFYSADGALSSDMIP